MEPKWKKAVLYVMKSPVGHLIPDKLYLGWKLRLICKEKMDWKNPKTMNEKMQWLKVYDRKQVYTTMADKYEARAWMEERIGEEYLVPLLGVWDNAKEIDFDSLPDKFVLKTTHDSHGVVVCKDKAALDKEQTVKFLNKRLKKNYYWLSREWCYKNIRPRIIAEALLEEETELQKCGLVDYKMYVFNGKVNCMMTISGRNRQGLQLNYYEKDWTPVVRKGIAATHESTEIPKPVNLEKMIEIAEKLSGDTKLLRVDFYEVNGKLYVGELTFFSLGGFMYYSPTEYNEIFGSEIDLT